MRLDVAWTQNSIFSLCFRLLLDHAPAVVWSSKRKCVVFHSVFNHSCGCDRKSVVKAAGSGIPCFPNGFQRFVVDALVLSVSRKVTFSLCFSTVLAKSHKFSSFSLHFAFPGFANGLFCNALQRFSNISDHSTLCSQRGALRRAAAEML